tara:strand:- start:206 stop:625 length:420 start_codon:yes stop_codon:yes gene_type:complete
MVSTELKTTSNEYRVVTGAIDNKNSSSIYLVLSTWVSIPYEDPMTEKKLIRLIKNELYDTDDLLFDTSRTIVDVSYSTLSPAQRVFLTIDMTLYQKDLVNVLPIKDDNLQWYVNEIKDTVINVIKTNLTDWNFYSSRKD